MESTSPRAAFAPPLLQSCCSKRDKRGGVLYEDGDWTTAWWLPAPPGSAGDPIPAGTPIAGTPGTQVAIPGDSETLPHLIFVPPGTPPADGWPVLVFLHGRGECSDFVDLPGVALMGPPQHAGRSPSTMPFAVLSPQKWLQGDWTDAPVPELVVNTLDHYLTWLPLDPQRVYLTGISKGGIGCWGLGSHAKYADRWAAIAPCSGGLRGNADGSIAQRAARLADTPVWAFHGASDSIVSVRMTDVAIDALSKTKRTAYAGEAKYSRLDSARGLDYAAASNMFTYGPTWLATTILAAIAPSFPGHASWVEAYYPPGCEAGKAPLYEWLLKFRRVNARVGPLK